MIGIFTKIRRRVFRHRKKRRTENKKSPKSFSFLTGIFQRARSRGVRAKEGILYFFLVLIILACLGWVVYSLFKLVRMKLPSAYRDDAGIEVEEWEGEGRMNVLLVGIDSREGEYGFVDAITVIAIDPDERSFGIFAINPDTSIYFSEHQRYLKLRNVYNFGVLDSEEKAPIRLIMEGVETLLSIKINRYIVMNEEGLEKTVNVLGGVYINNTEEIKDNEIANFTLKGGSQRLRGADFMNYLRVDDDGWENKLSRHLSGTEALVKRVTSYIAFIKLPYLVETIESYARTDLTRKELLRVCYQIILLKEIRSASMQEEGLERQAGESGPVFLPVVEQMDKDIQKVFVDSRVGKEQARVEVFNSTNVRGLAALKARWLRNIGIDVIRVGDTSDRLDQTTIFTEDPDKYVYTIEAIEKSLNKEVIIEEKKPKFICTGDVIVVLGEDLRN